MHVTNGDGIYIPIVFILAMPVGRTSRKHNFASLEVGYQIKIDAGRLPIMVILRGKNAVGWAHEVQR